MRSGLWGEARGGEPKRGLVQNGSGEGERGTESQGKKRDVD